MIYFRLHQTDFLRYRVMTYNPAKLDERELLSLLAKGLMEYQKRLRSGETDPFPYPEALVRGFNQLNIACTLQGVKRSKRPKSIPEFVETWGKIPVTQWPLQMELVSYTFTANGCLIETDHST